MFCVLVLLGIVWAQLAVMIAVLFHQQLNLLTCRWHRTLLCLIWALRYQCRQVTSSVVVQVSLHCRVSASRTDINARRCHSMAMQDITASTLHWRTSFLTWLRPSTLTSCMPPGVLTCLQCDLPRCSSWLVQQKEGFSVCECRSFRVVIFWYRGYTLYNHTYS